MKQPKCRSCRLTVDRDRAVRVGGNLHHQECANHRLKSRQHWDGQQWIKEGRSY